MGVNDMNMLMCIYSEGKKEKWGREEQQVLKKTSFKVLNWRTNSISISISIPSLLRIPLTKVQSDHGARQTQKRPHPC